MKKAISILLALVMVLSFASFTSFAANEIIAVNVKTTIDGVISPDEWSNKFTLNSTTGQAWVGSIGKSSTDYYFAYDKAGFYFAATINDSTPKYGPIPNEDHWVGVDCIQFAINPNNSIKKGLDGLFFTFGVKADGSVAAYRHNFSIGDISKQVTGKGSKRGVGEKSYTLEVFMPWSVFSGDSVNGLKLKAFSPVPNSTSGILLAALDLSASNALTAYKSSSTGDKWTVDTYSTITFGPTVVVPETPSAWAKAEVDAAVAAGIVPTAINSQFKSNITRSEFCDLIIKTIEVKKGMTIAAFVETVTGTVEKTFTDTTNPNVLAAAKLGIVNGRTETTFVPTAPITRQEATKMLTLAAKVMGADITADPTAFADETQIAAWAKEFVAYCAKAGIMNGISATVFSPLGRYTREQSMLTVYRLFKTI